MVQVNLTAVFGLTSDQYYMYSGVSQDSVWLVQNQWPMLTGYEVLLKLADYFDSIENPWNVSAEALAEFAGNNPYSTELLLSWYTEVGYNYSDCVYAGKEYIPQFGHPHNDPISYNSVFAVLSTIMFIVLGLRIYSRLLVGGFIRIYDWVIVAAAVVAFGYGTMNAIFLTSDKLNYYTGQWDHSWYAFSRSGDASPATYILYAVAVFFIKASLLLFYWSLTKWIPLRIATAFVGVIALGNSLSMMIIWNTYCTPHVTWRGNGYWTQVCNYTLDDESQLVLGGLNIATDLVIWVLPLPMVFKIVSGWRERFLTCLTFGLGAFACIACGLRLRISKSFITWDGYPPPSQTGYHIYAYLEMSIAIICSSVPAIRALIIKKRPSLLSSHDASSSEGKTYEGSSSYGKSDKEADRKQADVVTQASEES